MMMCRLALDLGERQGDFSVTRLAIQWVAALVVAAGGFLGAATPAGAVAFSNAAAIAIPASGTEGVAAPYPSTINVSGLTGAISDVNVTLTGFSHTFPNDVGLLLVGPTGANAVLMLAPPPQTSAASNLTLTFDDSATASIPCHFSGTLTLASGAYTPWNCVPDLSFSPPAPTVLPYGALLSAFNGTSANGTWSL